MPYEPLHHKYRPQTFADLAGQEAIATALSNALRQQRIAPAYLFVGARGTGKTSSARIFAKSLNCLNETVPTANPCGICEVCRRITNGSALDVIEIDAASNTGVDNIRELIERAQFAPVQCRYKVYVIDEVHMLSTAAFNALLKTLEEPPDRVVFVLATTDPQKVLPTIISRCQRFNFRRIPLEAMISHLTMIAHKEAIAIVPEAIQLIAQLAQGGLRDAESLLDQLSLLDGKITIERVWELVGAVPERELLSLLQAIAHNQPAAVLDQLRQLMDRGREPLIVLQNLASFYRDLLIAKTAPDRHDLATLTEETWTELCEFAADTSVEWITAGQQRLRTSEAQVKHSTQPRLWLEVTLMELLPSAMVKSGDRPALPINQPSNGDQVLVKGTPPLPIQSTPSPAPAAAPPSPPLAESITVPTVEPIAPSPVTQPVPPPDPPDPPPIRQQAELEQLWQEVLKRMEPRGTQMLLRQHGQLLEFTGTEARVGTIQQWYQTAKDRLARIEAAFQVVCEQPVKVRLEVSNPAHASPSPAANERSHPSPASTEPSAPIPSTPPPQAQPSSGNSAPPPPPNSTSVLEPPEVSPPLIKPKADLDLQMPWQEEDEALRAARSLAQMFNGQLVNLEDELQSANGLEISIDPESSALVDSDEDHEVPF
ncbi:MAG: DNA polymerase III subunit gamma/tau [Leptolyngbyaceae cyanobacterium SL_7_1]|nr:DNA polymerase III subunit gamma/tau [Leptolyngbyaceae cyanobacterium SL_7_1]